MDLKTTSQKAPLKDSPRTMVPDNHDSMALQTTALKPKGYQTEPTNWKYGQGVPAMELQTTSLKQKLSDKPSLGYESANTPMSQRAIDSKRNF